ncbi:MAG: hypothetical protein IPI51_20590 [Betaproteobacteria bacterium]|nr:hypothetical protein [Betaproteobacteria bacterium]
MMAHAKKQLPNAVALLLGFAIAIVFAPLVLATAEKSLQAMQSAESLAREDGRPPQSYPVGITVISRPWLLRGIYGGKVAVSAYYDCDNTVIKAPILVGDVPEMAP